MWHPARSELLYPGAEGDASRSLADVFVPDLLRFPNLARAEADALHVDVRAGDALYIPLGWWHAVSTPAQERSISISYWAQQPEGKEHTSADAGDEDVDHDFHDGEPEPSAQTHDEDDTCSAVGGWGPGRRVEFAVGR